MVNEEQLAILKQGVEAWNRWREENLDASIDLGQADLSAADLSGANLQDADLSRANLDEVILTKANLMKSNFAEAFMADAELGEADLRAANLRNAFLHGANFTGANLEAADLRGANLRYTSLMGANLVRANIDKAILEGSFIYAVNVWSLRGEFADQKDLVIAYEGEPYITVDNLETAQFIYLLLNNEKLRDVINTLTTKAVLILGRFTLRKRKPILDALRNKLREYDLLPIVFDFDRPTNKDFTETVITLAGLSYFVIADVTSPKSIPLELQATVPHIQVPFVPIIQEGERPFAMMVDLQKKYPWVLDTLTYSSIETLIKALKPAIIDPAIQKHNELRLIKAREPKIRSAEDFIDDRGLET